MDNRTGVVTREGRHHRHLPVSQEGANGPNEVFTWTEPALAAGHAFHGLREDGGL